MSVLVYFHFQPMDRSIPSMPRTSCDDINICPYMRVWDLLSFKNLTNNSQIHRTTSQYK